MTVIDERISPATRAVIEKDIFGHVIDGDRVEPTGDGRRSTSSIRRAVR